jgi:Zn-dependent peptidase ImmA (M78 family)
MPKQVKIGIQVFDIVERKRKEDGMLNDGNYGYTLDDRNLIVVAADMHVSKKQVTLLHEIMHAARMVWESPTKPKKNAEFEDWEHYFIGVWETSLLLVLRDNPDVVSWLLGGEQK